MRLGLFDSGVGGLTILKKVVDLCPNVSFIYLADTARIPYGVKTSNEIIQFADEISEWFISQNIDAFLVACNTTNAIALDVIKNKLDVPVFDLIRSASSTIQESRVGVLATPTTVKTKAYTNAILEFNPRTFVIEQSCPEFVPMIEMNKINSDEIIDLAIGYLEPLLKQKIESIILGCSHYPLITSLLTEILPTSVKLIDPAQTLALKLKLYMDSKTSNFSKKKYLVDSKFYATSDPKDFSYRAKQWMNVFPEVKLVSLQKKRCVS
ncbi:glutamate racemase [Prochlorococcus marinus]|uniref:Glutamate racemase n=1 Tax=Prochlorococcus marinus XMU1408 TaxID=2213228 RepID=A0A318QZM1_PROMR|nr:glutamate racemase [Prochlorococcus marinus]MBW3041644.1 glutamate racemase [Prochlorococcus marinus str. XMU1408]PYE02797.1 glutamate racemase [Prochlorococcus marinus XMU1408]